MHPGSLLRMQWFVDNFTRAVTEKPCKVLDVGSYDVNGSYRPLFNTDQFVYTGLDMEKGPNVDLVMETPYHWGSIETDSFDIVISGQAFEHIEFFWITMSEIARVVKKDGLVCIVAPNGFPEHRYPVDCYRFFSDGMVALARYVGLVPLHAHTNSGPGMANLEWFSYSYADSMLIAKKPYQGEAQLFDPKTYRCVPSDHVSLRSGLMPCPPKKVS